MPYLKFFWVILISIFLFGCFQTETVVRVKPDGSGFIEETFLVSNSALDSFQEFAKEFNDNADLKKEGKKDLPDPVQGMIEEARSRAGEYGPDVTFVSATPVKTKTQGGYKALYAFNDINTIRINQDLKNKAGKHRVAQGPAAKNEELILFRLAKGVVSILTVTMPKGKEAQKVPLQKDQEPTKNQTDSQSVEMMKEIFRDLGVKVSLEIEGSIIKTNATYRNKSEITLVELHFGKILENPEVFNKVSTAEPKTIEEMKELVKDLQGLKIEMNNPIVVEFN